MAATAATLSPTKSTRSRANIGRSASVLPVSLGLTSRAVMTALTPGRLRARLVSMLTMRACAKGLRRILPQSMSGRMTSAVK